MFSYLHTGLGWCNHYFKDTAPMKITLFSTLAALALAVIQPVAGQEFTFTPSFPSGVDWSNATPDQISDAVYKAVQENPERAVEIVTAALEAAKGTGRFPSIATSDGKQFVDPDNPNREGTIEDVADRIGNAAKSANPALAPQIDAAVMSSVPTVTMLPGSGDGGGSGGGGGTGGSGGSVPLPSGFGGGGGGGGTTTTSDSN